MIAARALCERENITPEVFRQEIYPAGEPVILRGFVTDWPAVALAKRSGEDLIALLKGEDNGAAIDCLHGPPEIGGHFFYNQDMTGVNFARRRATLTEALDLMTAADGAAVSIQSTPTDSVIPGFSVTNRLSFLPPSAPARIWIGNAITVQTHFDLSQNIACVVAGRRRFTLFPPHQLSNLYMGPIERTLAGTPVSLVRLEDVDAQRFPRFREAASHALAGELGPGDAIFIPYFWWHHVKSLAPFNVLVNYWWNEYDVLGSPMDALLHAILCLRDIPPAMKAPWKAMFDEFVFSAPPSGIEHIPAHARGGLGHLDPAARAGLWSALAQGVNGHIANHFSTFARRYPPQSRKPSF
jgi:hypothetical protein